MVDDIEKIKRLEDELRNLRNQYYSARRYEEPDSYRLGSLSDDISDIEYELECLRN